MESNPVIRQDLDEIARTSLPWEKLRNKTVLVTGAAGMLASYIVKSLLYRNLLYPDENIQVLALVRDTEKAKQKFSDFLQYSFFNILQVSLEQPVSVYGPVDFIIHAASQASPRYYGTDPVGTALPNVLGTYHLLRLAVEKKSEKFLFFSTSEVYGNTDSSDDIKETDLGKIDPLSVRSCYAESKRMGENLCILFSHQYGVNVSIARPFHTYGPGLRFDDGRVFADFVASIVRNENIVMHSDGSAVRSFCYISDATVGFLTVLLKGENGAAYNIANPHATVSVKQLAETLVKLFPEKKLTANFAPRDPATYVPSTFHKLIPNIDKAMQLGWRPTTGIEDGFRKTILSYTA